ncbi:hypothetical protein E3N88_39512 [Mikania micrantha]|uniref:TRF2/HOY1 PH-like domain-containing protein n=1 Tax=Mikania micrantha TaxID=192012 RepID=A0A5N6LXW3_9ASTR|nr:hypothetical protein E3N88_39512 [Mikania micrantha]
MFATTNNTSTTIMGLDEVKCMFMKTDYQSFWKISTKFMEREITLTTCVVIPVKPGDLVAKCYFAKHKLVWEDLDGGLKKKIEIQWSDIISLKATYPDDGPVETAASTGEIGIKLNEIGNTMMRLKLNERGPSSSSRSEFHDPSVGPSEFHDSNTLLCFLCYISSDGHLSKRRIRTGDNKELKGLVAGLHSSMSMSDLVNHIENRITKNRTPGDQHPLSHEEQQSLHILEDISRCFCFY